ncbi:hypothetical protein N7533_006526 [Penicillium manginii]|uniref:uncharacterized protein n=1 Tax=Penicillium manginii TaxID=203109 RepID=UPI0025468FAB|nr:uncharacterized protein N7533_006526 [Penicillium manginii]KAJ5749498.1 hypothetical protein N7533_006526 [Penicillium manginii]
MVAIESRGRRKTYFFPVAPNRTATGTNVPKSQPSTGGKGEDETNVSKSRPFPGGKGGDGTAAEPARHKPDLVMKPDKRTQFFNLPVFYEDPWTDYEKGIEIFPKRHTSLCRHRRNREDLVHIQQLKACTATESLINAVGRYSHPSFLRLLCCYHYDQSTFLVWEPVELSLAQVIGSKYSIREAELTSIVWPIIQGIRYLRDSSRALGSLTYDTIFLTSSGGVKIADVDRSCVIDTEDMNAATLKLFALSDMITGLRKQMSPMDPWSPRAQNLPARLMSTPLDDLFGDDDLVAESKGGELKMLVNILSKISHYDVKFP